MNEDNQPKQGKLKSLPLIITIVILAIIIILLLIFRSQSTSGDVTPVSPGRDLADVNGFVSDGHLPFEDPEEVRERLQQAVDESMLAIKINANPMFANGSESGALSIENPANNNYKFQVEITLDDTKEIIYTSPVIMPGQHIMNTPLDVVLPAGEYKATAIFYAYNDDNQHVGQAGAGLNITILE